VAYGGLGGRVGDRREDLLDLFAQGECRRQVAEVLPTQLLVDPPVFVVGFAGAGDGFAGSGQVVELAALLRRADLRLDPGLERHPRRLPLAHHITTLLDHRPNHCPARAAATGTDPRTGRRSARRLAMAPGVDRLDRRGPYGLQR